MNCIGYAGKQQIILLEDGVPRREKNCLVSCSTDRATSAQQGHRVDWNEGMEVKREGNETNVSILSVNAVCVQE